MILHLIRHGASVANLAHRFNPEDDPLDPDTVRALRAAAFRFEPYDRIYVSPLRRAVQTAEHLGLTGWTLEPRISERGLGVFAGLTAAECRARHAEAFADFSRLEPEPAIPGGESRAAHLERVTAWLADTEASGASRVLAVTHGGVIDFVYRLASGAPLHGGDDIFGGGNLSLSEFEIERGALRVLAFARPLAP
ncbi:MAG TPA: histidine phosphatase family protein [Caulobacteraceae bacterium]|nr:histidine phosphatase family protein [Caulobacteraceae bacterium]